MRRSHHLLCILSSSVLLLLSSSVAAQPAPSSDAFLPTWKLLSAQEKQQFIAGYLFGWRDAETVTDIATQYIRDNPQRALEGLESVRRLYDMKDLKPAFVVQALDEYFADPTNSDSGLSAAMTHAKNRLR